MPATMSGEHKKNDISDNTIMAQTNPFQMWDAPEPNTPKKVNWKTHRIWLAKNAKPRPKRLPRANPVGRFNPNKPIQPSQFQEFLKQNKTPNRMPKPILNKKATKMPKWQRNWNKKVNWEKNKIWMESKAKPRPTREPPANPVGRLNPNKPMPPGVLEEFLIRNNKPMPYHSSSCSSMIKKYVNKKHKVSMQRFNRWYETRVKPDLNKIFVHCPLPVEPTRKVKALRKLMPTMVRLAVPREYVVQKPMTLAIRPKALRFKGGKLYDRLSKPKKTWPQPPEEFSRDTTKITPNGLKRINELAQPIPVEDQIDTSNRILRWPFTSFDKEELDGKLESATETKNSTKVNDKTNESAGKDTFTKSKEEVDSNNGNPQNKSQKTKKTKPFRKLNQKPSINVFVLFNKDNEQVAKNKSKKKQTLPEKVSSSTGQSRFEQLAKPRFPIAVPFKDQPPNEGIPDRVLKYQPSARMVALAKPRWPILVPFEKAKTMREAHANEHWKKRYQEMALKRQERIRKRTDDEQKAMEADAIRRVEEELLAEDRWLKRQEKNYAKMEQQADKNKNDDTQDSAITGKRKNSQSLKRDPRAYRINKNNTVNNESSNVGRRPNKDINTNKSSYADQHKNNAPCSKSEPNQFKRHNLNDKTKINGNAEQKHTRYQIYNSLSVDQKQYNTRNEINKSSTNVDQKHNSDQNRKTINKRSSNVNRNQNLGRTITERTITKPSPDLNGKQNSGRDDNENIKNKGPLNVDRKQKKDINNKKSTNVDPKQKSSDGKQGAGKSMYHTKCLDTDPNLDSLIVEQQKHKEAYAKRSANKQSDSKNEAQVENPNYHAKCLITDGEIVPLEPPLNKKSEATTKPNPSIKQTPLDQTFGKNTDQKVQSPSTSPIANRSQTKVNPVPSKQTTQSQQTILKSVSKSKNNISNVSSRTKSPEKVKSDIDYRSDLEESRKAGEFIEKTRNPIQKVN